jgi:hypothetical protein
MGVVITKLGSEEVSAANQHAWIGVGNFLSNRSPPRQGQNLGYLARAVPETTSRRWISRRTGLGRGDPILGWYGFCFSLSINSFRSVP